MKLADSKESITGGRRHRDESVIGVQALAAQIPQAGGQGPEAYPPALWMEVTGGAVAMAPRAGLEPATSALTVPRSTS